MKSMDKLTTGVAYGTSAGSAGYWFLQLLDKVTPSQWAAIGVLGNGKQNTYFSSLDNMVAQGNVLPVLYGEMRVGSRVASQEISTADEGDGGQVVVIGR